MEKEKNNINWTVIIVTIIIGIVVLIALFSSGNPNNNQSQNNQTSDTTIQSTTTQPTNVSTISNTDKQTTPVATINQNANQPTTKIINNDDEQDCTQQSAIFWQKQGNLCPNCRYVSHYNSSQGKCFVLSTGGVVSATTSFNLVLWDIYNGVKVAQYISIGGYNYQGCTINNAHIDGCTYYQFGSFLNSEMETKIY